LTKSVQGSYSTASNFVREPVTRSITGLGQRNEPCRRYAFGRDACTLQFPPANPADAYRHHSVQLISAFGIGPTVRIAHFAGVFEKLKRAIHVAVFSTLPTNVLADSLRSPSLASRSSNASAMSSVTSRDHPSAVLKATTRIGLE